jgi:hypothetical protein
MHGIGLSQPSLPRPAASEAAHNSQGYLAILGNKWRIRWPVPATRISGLAIGGEEVVPHPHFNLSEHRIGPLSCFWPLAHSGESGWKVVPVIEMSASFVPLAHPTVIYVADALRPPLLGTSDFHRFLVTSTTVKNSLRN